jgi:hypothetical protein
MDVTPSIRRFFQVTAWDSDARRRGGQGTAMVKTFLTCALLLAAAPAVAAQDCGSDLQALAGRREAALKNINALVSSSHGKKLDPEAFCARSAPLTSAEDAMIAYMVKNKDWCQIPDDAIAQLRASHAKSAAFGGKACTVAAQIRKMKTQAAQAAQAGGGPGGPPTAQPLPTGPL